MIYDCSLKAKINILGFYRDNNTKILECLRDIWRKDRRAEWSIWMVYSKVEMPHHFINSGMSDIINHSAHKRASSVLKLTDVSFSVLSLFCQFFVGSYKFCSDAACTTCS